MTTLDEKLKAVGARRRKKIEVRAARLIAEEMSLRELRRAHSLTQRRVANRLGIGQEGVSRLEQRSDLLISTLRDYVEAMGGRLHLLAEFPDRPSIAISGLASIDDPAGARSAARPRKAKDRPHRHPAAALKSRSSRSRPGG